MPRASQILYSADLWESTQGANQKVEAFIAEIEQKAKRAGVEDETQIVHAILHGLKPSIKKFAVQHAVTTIGDLRKFAILAESTETKEEDGEKLNLLTKALQRLESKFDAIASAPITRSVSALSSRETTPERNHLAAGNTFHARPRVQFAIPHEVSPAH
jgi:hypothetical protein